jgi:integrase
MHVFRSGGADEASPRQSQGARTSWRPLGGRVLAAGRAAVLSFPDSAGWDRDRADAERRFLMEKVNRGEWTPPPPAAEAVAAPAETPLYAEVAALALARQVKRLEDPDGARAQQLEYALSIGLDLLGPRPVDKIDEAAIDEMVDALIDQRLAIEAARERGDPLMEDYVDTRTGRTYRRRRRGLSNSTINLAIGAHQRVLRYAHRQGLIERLPDLSECRQRAQRPRRSYLQATELEVVLIAASQLEQENSGLDWAKVNHIRTSSASAVALRHELGVSDTLIRKVRHRQIRDGSAQRPNRNDVPRRAIIEALLLLGPRVAELCALHGHDVDLASRRVRIRREVTKTDAGERVVRMLPAVRKRLVDHRARRPMRRSSRCSPPATGVRTRRGTS